MQKALLVHNYDSYESNLEEIHECLRLLYHQLSQELDNKQSIVNKQELEIQLLKEMLAAKDALVTELNAKILDTQRNNEGNKQLIKKLINDMVRKQQDIEWYKRTYESRSLLGTLREKIFGKKK
jgi:hypothetical protein